ncbi:FecR family protein [Flavilitoribacter nigricans]|nr:FecR domain-containing protein [Flavilitoribacter nigricans]
MTSKEQLLAKYYRGECTREEMELLLDQLRDAKDEDYSDIMARLWRQLNDFPDLEDGAASRIMEKTLTKIGNMEDELGKAGSKPSRHSGSGRFFRRLSAAAAILALIAAGTWWIRSADSVELHTAYGEQRTISLPDQSTVILNANSNISFHQDWSEDEVRKVWLEGEAYFKVRKDTTDGRKFQVVTRDLTVEVLGTVFNVHTREEATQVFLEEGKINVDLEDQEEDILMDPGELVTYSVKTHIPQKRKIVEEAPSSWKDGTIILQEVTLRAIIQKMEEIYGVSSRVESQTLLDRTFNFPMPVNNLDTAVLLLMESTGLIIEQEDDELIVK